MPSSFSDFLVDFDVFKMESGKEGLKVPISADPVFGNINEIKHLRIPSDHSNLASAAGTPKTPPFWPRNV